MSDQSQANLAFLPWVRQGAAAAITTPDTPAARLQLSRLTTGRLKTLSPSILHVVDASRSAAGVRSRRPMRSTTSDNCETASSRLLWAKR
jgi:hypothetical protein